MHETLSLHLGKYDRDFHERGTGYFIVALFLLLFAIVMSYAMIQDYRILLIQKQKI